MGRGNRGNNQRAASSVELRQRKQKEDSSVEETLIEIKTEEQEVSQAENVQQQTPESIQKVQPAQAKEATSSKNQDSINKSKQEIEDKLREIHARKQEERKKEELSEETAYEDELLEDFGIGDN